MAGTKNGPKNGQWIARNLLIGVAILLLAGIAGSLVMGVRARNSALKTATDGASTIADRSLALVFKPSDLNAAVNTARATELDRSVAGAVLDPSTFTAVTLWSEDGQVLYSTGGRIGSFIDGERTRIRDAIKGAPQIQSSGGSFSVMVPLKLASGVGSPAAVELTTSSTPIDGAPAPWRTNALFLVVLLCVVGFALYRVMVSGSPAASPRRDRAMQPAPMPVPASPSAAAAVAHPQVPSPGLREEAEARRKAEDRARAAEERLSVMQDQYRSTLDDLRGAERRVQEQVAGARPDPQLQEQLARTEQRAREFELRARDLEVKYRLLEDEHRELARLAPDPDIMSKATDRLEALKAERDQLRRERDALVGEREEMATQHEELTKQLADGVEPTQDPALMRRVQQAETEVIGVRAELEGAQTQLNLARRELETLQDHSQRAKELQEDLDAVHVESLHTREAFETAQTDLQATRAELEDTRSEVRILRNEEQRAAMLTDELRASRAELESASASHRAELIEREAELEEKVRGLREEFQEQVHALEAAHRDAIATRERDLADQLSGASAAHAAELAQVQRELADRDERYGSAEQAVQEAQALAERLTAELADTKRELGTTADKLVEETAGATALTDRAEKADRQAAESAARLTRLATELESATQDNAEVNRRLQELEARRALEIAEGEGRANLDDLLRITQERLAGQTEKLIAAEDHMHQLERENRSKVERIEEVEGELRHVQMAEAMRQIRGEGHEAAAEPDEVVIAPAAVMPMEDRRSATPFIKELSLDAHKSLNQILGLTQILKHKKDAKEQTQLVRQLTAYARRLDHVVSDMTDADSLAKGTIELNKRRTDLDPMLRRVVEESGVESDHEVVIASERVVVTVDQIRTEQILSGLLRASADRTPSKKAITVRLSPHEGGALISVEDPEPSSDASLSPVVERFAEVQGGWATVESREEGGSAFRVFLPGTDTPADAPLAPSPALEPDLADTPVDATADPLEAAMADVPAEDVPIVVGAQREDGTSENWGQSPEQLLVQELHRLSEITAED
jgi:hypothetical protein